MSLHTAIVPPKGVWWKPAGKQERIWIIIAFVWCMVLFAMMPLWHIKGGQNPSGIRSRVEPKEFAARVKRFIDDYQIGEENGIPVVKPPPGSHVYLQASMWSWTPVIHLEQGASYTLHLSSLDINHGFSLYPANINFQIIPGYDYGLRITPNTAGDYKVICNEFCGISHHLMLGKIVVEPRASVAELAQGGAG
jgi:cytochrome c oxidase subunit 2